MPRDFEEDFPGIFQELADLFVSSPSLKQLLSYRPSEGLQRRARKLLAKQGEGRLTDEERQELDEFMQAETLMRLVKAKLRGGPQFVVAMSERVSPGLRDLTGRNSWRHERFYFWRVDIPCERTA